MQGHMMPSLTTHARSWQWHRFRLGGPHTCVWSPMSVHRPCDLRSTEPRCTHALRGEFWAIATSLVRMLFMTVLTGFSDAMTCLTYSENADVLQLFHCQKLFWTLCVTGRSFSKEGFFLERNMEGSRKHVMAFPCTFVRDFVNFTQCCS